MHDQVMLGSTWRWPSSALTGVISNTFIATIVCVADNGVVVRYDDNSTEIVSDKELLAEWEQIK